MNVAQVLVEQLAQVGITATIKPVEWETWLSETYMGRDFESTVVALTPLPSAPALCSTAG